MPHTPKAHIALLVDFANVRMGLTATAQEATEGAPTPPTTRELARALLRYASGLGRVSVARAYADWSRVPRLAQQLTATRVEPVLVPATEEGEDRSHIRLVVDAMEVLYAGDEPDAFILASSDPTLLPLVQALRSDGSEVIVIAGESALDSPWMEAADRRVALEAVLDDTVADEDAEPVEPRAWRTEGPGDRTSRRDSGREGRASRSRERGWAGVQSGRDVDFDAYAWEPFIGLIDELEERLPFVGVRYLVNKVLAPHNCGIADPRLKRDLMNRAVEDGLVEMYSVGNVDHRADPVTACRLNREHPLVVEVLGEDSGVRAHEGAEPAGGEFETHA